MPQLSTVIQETLEAESIEVNNRVYELKAAGHAVLVMSLGEAYFDIPLMPMDVLPFPDIYHYSHSRGIPGLRAKLARYFDERYDVPINPEREIVVTAGSKAAIYMTLLAILDPGDEVIVQEPAWVSYPEQIRLCGGQTVRIPYDRTVFDYGAYITPRTRAIIINTPHNPRGEVLTKAHLEHLLALAEQHDLWLLSDEAYSDFLIDEKFLSLGAVDREKRHAVVFNSISKNYGISGWRLGYVIGNEALIYNVLKINQHVITCPPTILALYVERYFDDILAITRPQMEAVVRKRQALLEYMDAIGLDHLPGAATFYAFVSIAPSALDSRTFSRRLLDDAHVSVVPGIGYGDSCDAYVRVSVGTLSTADCRRGLDAIRALIDATSP